MSDSAPLDEVTTAVLTLLRTSGRAVFDGAYNGDPVRPPYPYHLLYVVGGHAEPMPDLDADTRTVTVTYQVSTVAALRNQCERASQQVRDLLVGRTRDNPAGLYTAGEAGWAHPLPIPAGWEVVDRRPDPALPGTDRTGEAPNAIFTRPARYQLTLSPA